MFRAVDHGPRIRRDVADDAHAEPGPIFHNQAAPQHQQQRRRPSQSVQCHAQPLPPVVDHERGFFAPSRDASDINLRRIITSTTPSMRRLLDGT